MSKYIDDVDHYWNVEWENVPAMELAETIAGAYAKWCTDDEGWTNHENVADVVHHLLTRRQIMKECDNCSRLVDIGEMYCGDDECLEDE